MSIIRALDSFSLPELFKLIEQDNKSGRLIIETPISQTTDKREGIYYIWFQNGCLIAVSNCINQKGLINLISQRGWLSPLIIERLRTLCPTGMPLGIYLRKMKLLSPEKLNLAFQLQLHQVYRLFQLSGGRFRFDDFVELQDRILTVPWLEMTGNLIKTREVSLYALRLMENSENLKGQLPAPSQILSRIISQPELKLTTIERQLWDFADSCTSLLAIAKIIQQPISKIQITAFRMIALGLVETMFQPQENWSRENYALQGTSDRLLLSKGNQQRSFFYSIGGLFKKKA